MSWIGAERLSPSDSESNLEETADKRVSRFIDTYGDVGRDVFGSFTQIDPISKYTEEGGDEYIGYATRFMDQLGDRKLHDLERDTIQTLVAGSFHGDQYVPEDAMSALVAAIEYIRDNRNTEEPPNRSAS